MSFVINTSGISIADLQAKPRVTEPCDSLVEVEKVIIKDRAVILVFHVLNSTRETQIGRSYVEHLNLPNPIRDSAEALQNRILIFAMAFGLVSEQDVESRADLDIDFEKMIGKRAIIQFISNQYSQIKMTFKGIWHIDDSAAPSVS